MRELSMHILDLAQNAIAAGATKLEIEVSADTRMDRLTISLADNGRGMEPELLGQVRDPFTTTRRTRRVGLGIPMFEAAAKASGGRMAIQSATGKGTYLAATFQLSNIDRPPLGDIAATLISIIAVNPGLHLIYIQKLGDAVFILDTDEINKELDGVPINENAVLKWIGEYVKDQTSGDLLIS